MGRGFHGYSVRQKLVRAVLLGSVTLGAVWFGSGYLLSRIISTENRFLEQGLIAGVTLAVTVWMLPWFSTRMERRISAPMRRVLDTISRAVENGDYTVRVEKQDGDELGRLADGINHLLAKIQSQEAALQQAHNDLEKKIGERTGALQLEIHERERAEQELEQVHRQLLEISREIGMAEVAAGVLHNVGNVLNSVNVSANLISEGVRNTSASAAGLAKAAGLFHEHAHDLSTFMTADPKGKMLPNYLSWLAERLADDHKDIHKEVQILSQNVAHIRNIIAAQQHYAATTGISERIEVQELVEYALQLSGGLTVHPGIEVKRAYQQVPPVEVEKHKVIQILVNLFRNAREAMEDQSLRERRLTVSIEQRDRRRIAIAVSDTGVGIPAEHLARIFSLGFTTKKNGHGIGLHSAALAARQMKAELSAASEGPGRGATFTLVLLS